MNKKQLRKKAINIQNMDSKGGGKIRPMTEAIAAAKASEEKKDD